MGSDRDLFHGRSDPNRRFSRRSVRCQTVRTMRGGAQWVLPEGNRMSLAVIALIVLLALVIGAMPTWSHSRNWGYMPSGGLGLIAFVVLVMLATGEL